jgi:aerobic C4-dicarboxylate transport protein
VVVAKWEGALDEARMHSHLDRETSEEADLLSATGALGS